MIRRATTALGLIACLALPAAAQANSFLPVARARVTANKIAQRYYLNDPEASGYRVNICKRASARIVLCGFQLETDGSGSEVVCTGGIAQATLEGEYIYGKLLKVPIRCDTYSSEEP